MRRPLSAVLLSSVLLSCLGQPTPLAPSLAATLSLARGTGDGAASLHIVDGGATLDLPTGECTFRLDAAEPMNFAEGTGTRSRYLKLNGRRGELTIDPVGGKRWSGSGRLSIDWPDYPNSDTFELKMDGVGSTAGSAPASCKYQIADGVGVDWYVSVQ